jgi:hypothetical protein
VLQTWGAYGILWPVIHQQLGVDPDLGRGALSVVPQIPPGQTRVAGSDIAVGSGHVDVQATSRAGTLTVTVDAAVRARLTLGVTLPAKATVSSVRLDGRPVAFRQVTTTRGTEVLSAAGLGGHHTLVVGLG